MGNARRYPLLFAKGVAMGAADVVPGVSGGTIAFISGIYDELIDSIRAIDLTALKTLASSGPAACWRQINGNFLLVLFAGILFSIFSLARLVTYLLEHHPVHVWAFFFGLIVASAIYIYRQQPHWRTPQVAAFALGAGVALFVSFSPPLAVSATPLTVFLSGMLAICAMILPGISGSFILLLLGIYPVIIGAVGEMNLQVLGVFAVGAGIGLLAFSRLLSWLLHRHRPVTLSTLVGFLAGSLVVVWPWQRHPDPTADTWSRQLMLPAEYGAAVGAPHVAAAVVLIAIGVIAVLGLEYLGSRASPEAEKT